MAASARRIFRKLLASFSRASVGLSLLSWLLTTKSCGAAHAGCQSYFSGLSLSCAGIPDLVSYSQLVKPASFVDIVRHVATEMSTKLGQLTSKQRSSTSDQRDLLESNSRSVRFSRVNRLVTDMFEAMAHDVWKSGYQRSCNALVCYGKSRIATSRRVSYQFSRGTAVSKGRDGMFSPRREIVVIFCPILA